MGRARRGSRAGHRPLWHCPGEGRDRIHPRLTTRSAWIDHHGELPIIEETLIRLTVDHLPGGHDPLPVWLWCSKTGMTSEDVELRWRRS